MNVLIIGGSSDIGVSIANYLKDNGYNVIITYNNHKCDLSGIESIKCDITKEEDIANTLEYVKNKYKSIDILINLAAISRDNDIIDITKKDFLEVLEVNLVGTFLCNQLYIKNNNHGMIINMSSTDGIDTYSKYSLNYSTSKSGIITMTKVLSLSTENKLYCICPNWIDSDSTNDMDQEYLNNELKRIKQSRLITKEELNKSIYKIITSNEKSGTIFRIDIKDDKLWIEKI